MEQITKAVINLKEGTLELQGSEAFVAKYLEEYKDMLKQVKYKADFKAQEEPTPRQEGLTTPRPALKEPVEIKKTKGLKKVKDFSPESFDIYPDGKPSLEEFITEKKPGIAAGYRVLVIAYYIKNTLGMVTFSEGNIEYVYRTLNLGNKPVHLRQLLTDLKNKKMQFNNDGNGWSINRVGEKFVDEKMPLQSEDAE